MSFFNKPGSAPSAPSSTPLDPPSSDRKVVSVQPFSFECDGVTTTATPRFMPFGTRPGNAGVLEVWVPIPFGGVIRNLCVQHKKPGSDPSDEIVYTVWREKMPTRLSLRVSAGAEGGQNVLESFTVSTGDRVGVRVTKDQMKGSSPRGILVTFELGES